MSKSEESISDRLITKETKSPASALFYKYHTMNNEKENIKNTNDDSNAHRDEIGENTGTDTQLNKEIKTDAAEQEKSESSNKEQGPAGENL
ncbi:MAG: hypothetical protein EOP46_00455 [Sphingobacteriaceae bacterium]|nr:MAG: hypothetical protein EOP46_00455 [Sphingobacteriaceae bacterium]